MKQEDLTIILPAYNEELSIEQAIEMIHEENSSSPIIVVNDGSTDETAKILERLKEDLNLKIITHDIRQGYGAALKTGFKEVSTSVIGFQDVDLTYDPRMFSRLIDHMEKNDLVCAWSNRLHGEMNGMPTHRKLGNILMVKFFDTFVGANIKDCASGQRVITRKALEEISPDTLPDGWGIMSAFSKRLVRNGMEFDTLPSHYFKRVGSSKLHMFSGFMEIMYHIIKDG